MPPCADVPQSWCIPAPFPADSSPFRADGPGLPAGYRAIRPLPALYRYPCEYGEQAPVSGNSRHRDCAELVLSWYRPAHRIRPGRNHYECGQHSPLVRKEQRRRHHNRNRCVHGGRRQRHCTQAVCSGSASDNRLPYGYVLQIHRSFPVPG